MDVKGSGAWTKGSLIVFIDCSHKQMYFWWRQIPKMRPAIQNALTLPPSSLSLGVVCLHMKADDFNGSERDSGSLRP